MKNVTLTIILIVIIGFTVANYYFISHFSNPHAVISPSSKPTAVQTPFCQSNHLSATIIAQGAAGNIYGTLTVTNTGKAACEVVLGNTITALFNARNIITHYEQNDQEENFILAPGANVYSQVHYPNGPQCQSTIIQQPLAFFYKTNQTSLAFKPAGATGKLIVQACSSQSEKTIIDIWPISTTPITQ